MKLFWGQRLRGGVGAGVGVTFARGRWSGITFARGRGCQQPRPRAF